MRSQKLIRTAGIVITASMALTATASAANLGNCGAMPTSETNSQIRTAGWNGFGSGQTMQENMNEAKKGSTDNLSSGLNGKTESNGQLSQQNYGCGRFGLEKLVKDETITEDQAEAVANAVKDADEDEDLDSVLDALVEDGTLTQDEADAISESMSGSQLSQQNYDCGRFGLEKLVKDETITEDQAEAVASAVKDADEDEDLDSVLDALVEDGTLTQDEADAISESMSGSQLSQQDHGCGRFGRGNQD